MYKLDKDGKVFEHAVDNKIFIDQGPLRQLGFIDIVRNMVPVGAREWPPWAEMGGAGCLHPVPLKCKGP